MRPCPATRCASSSSVTQRNPRSPLCLLRNRSDFRPLDLVIERVVTLMMFSLEYTIHANVIVIG